MCFSEGELQSVLCAAFVSAEVAVTGTLSGDLYKWIGHTLSSVVKGAHHVSSHDNPFLANIVP